MKIEISVGDFEKIIRAMTNIHVQKVSESEVDNNIDRFEDMQVPFAYVDKHNKHECTQEEIKEHLEKASISFTKISSFIGLRSVYGKKCKVIPPGEYRDKLTIMHNIKMKELKEKEKEELKDKEKCDVNARTL